MWLIAIFLILGAIIFVHEMGHLLFAKWFGVKVKEFSIGFGKTLFSKKIGETEYMVCAIPIGGYVKFFDEESKDADNPLLFDNQPIYKRLPILSGGSLFNFLFAVFLMWALFTVGIPTVAPIVGDIVEDSPAKKAGILRNDRIIKIGEQEILTWNDILDPISSSEGEITVLVLRNDKQIVLKVVPEIKAFQTPLKIIEQRRVIGISPSGEIMSVSYPIGDALFRSLSWSYNLLESQVIGFQQIFKGKIGIEEMSGPVGIAAMTKRVHAAGYANLVIWTAILSLAIGFINFLPIPIFDGGHIFLFLPLEWVFGKAVSRRIQGIISPIFVALLITFALYITYNDIFKIFSG